MATAKTPKAQNGIVERIMAFLKLGEAGKLDSFFNRITRTLGREITALEQNIKSIGFENEQVLSELDDQLEDAKEALNDAYLNVTPEDVATNQCQVEFMETYLLRISNAQGKIASIEDKIESIKEEMKIRTEKLQAEIDSRKETINSIGSYNKK